MKLHGYFRSSAAYRVRIALNLKGLRVEHLPYHLRKHEQQASSYLALNPQGLVPSLELDDATVLTQSLAIIEWIDEVHPLPPLLPGDQLRRARIRAFAQVMACDIHPIQNLKVLARLRQMGTAETDVTAWAAWVNQDGLAACETLANEPGPFCFGATPTLADICLVPQLASARRFGVDVRQFRVCLRPKPLHRGCRLFATQHRTVSLTRNS